MELGALAEPERLTGAPDEQHRAEAVERRDREVDGPGRAFGDRRRRQRALRERGRADPAAGASPATGQQLAVAHERAPLGEELARVCVDEALAERGGARRLAQLRRGLERVEAGVGEATDDPDLLDRGAVDLLDLA